ncbi:tyrosine-protein phosphatase non-receptor type 2 isoform X3 [Cryptotermes secundus]|uniref:tyrosine-protein phosphatase non-receptor type 2 isoform X3 n=1 Tax=Cryptotermes secundus TaxID=105785 RepID=UPI000CD7D73F|nr:tyrosine-protein phosphatase non-receptor type 2 isoform X3 [Cryptotermes secundus]
MNTVASKSNVASEFLEIDSKGAWPLLYQHIRNECLNYDYTFLEARKSQNKNLNRYRDVSPYDHSRVVLSKGPCDYINANLVTMERAHRRYILTQGPLPHTTGHFWLMVWEQNCKAVLMLNRIIEKNQVKCHQYWPLGSQPGIDNVMELTDVGLKVQFISEDEAPYYTTRILRLTETESGNSRDILHFHYTTWPDFGVPESPTAFLNFLMVVRESGALDQNVGPPVVHCSAGIGRSGTFCLVDSCLVLIEEIGIDAVNVREVLLEMRKFRMGLIQTPDQLRFSYWAIIEGSNKHLNGSSGQDDTSEGTIELTAVPVNHTGHEDAEGEEPPPLPPPRGESLNRSHFTETESSPTGNHVELSPDTEEQPPDKPLPCEPPIELPQPPTRQLPSEPAGSDEGSYSTSSPSSSPEYIPLKDRDGVRMRSVRKDRLLQQVREIKRKQQAAESWQQLKRSILQPLTIGIGVGVLLLGGAIAYSYFTSRV